MASKSTKKAEKEFNDAWNRYYKHKSKKVRKKANKDKAKAIKAYDKYYHIKPKKKKKKKGSSDDDSLDTTSLDDTSSDDDTSDEDSDEEKAEKDEQNKESSYAKRMIPPVRVPNPDWTQNTKQPYQVRDDSFIPVVVLSTISGTYPLVPRTYSHYIPEDARDKFYADIISIQTQNLMSNDIPTATITLGNEYDWSSVLTVNDLVRIDLVDPNDAFRYFTTTKFGEKMYHTTPTLTYMDENGNATTDPTEFMTFNFNGDLLTDEDGEEKEAWDAYTKSMQENTANKIPALFTRGRPRYVPVDVPQGTQLMQDGQLQYYNSGQAVFTIAYGLVSSTNRQSSYNDGKTTHTIVCQGMAKIFTNIQLATFSELSANMSGYQMIPDDPYSGIAFGGQTSASIISQVINKFIFQNQGGMNTYDYENVTNTNQNQSLLTRSTSVQSNQVYDLMGDTVPQDVYDQYMDYIAYNQRLHAKDKGSDDSDNDDTKDSGLSSDEEQAKEWIAQRESGGNYDARNGQLAYNVMLTLNPANLSSRVSLTTLNMVKLNRQWLTGKDVKVQSRAKNVA